MNIDINFDKTEQPIEGFFTKEKAPLLMNAINKRRKQNAPPFNFSNPSDLMSFLNSNQSTNALESWVDWSRNSSYKTIPFEKSMRHIDFTGQLLFTIKRQLDYKKKLRYTILNLQMVNYYIANKQIRGELDYSPSEILNEIKFIGANINNKKMSDFPETDLIINESEYVCTISGTATIYNHGWGGNNQLKPTTKVGFIVKGVNIDKKTTFNIPSDNMNFSKKHLNVISAKVIQLIPYYCDDFPNKEDLKYDNNKIGIWFPIGYILEKASLCNNDPIDVSRDSDLITKSLFKIKIN